MQELLLVSETSRTVGRATPSHDLHEALVLALLSMLAGGRTCVDMEDFGCGGVVAADVSDVGEPHPELLVLLVLLDLKGAR